MAQHCLDEGLQVFDVPLFAIYLGDNPWNIQTIDEFAYHMKRAMDSDLNHPITFDDMGQVCDGWHRICKAMVLGIPTIKAYRVKKMPRIESTEQAES